MMHTLLAFLRIRPRHMTPELDQLFAATEGWLATRDDPDDPRTPAFDMSTWNGGDCMCAGGYMESCARACGGDIERAFEKEFGKGFYGSRSEHRREALFFPADVPYPLVRAEHVLIALTEYRRHRNGARAWRTAMQHATSTPVKY
jgi:hypothetical protein